MWPEKFTEFANLFKHGVQEAAPALGGRAVPLRAISDTLEVHCEVGQVIEVHLALRLPDQALDPGRDFLPGSLPLRQRPDQYLCPPERPGGLPGRLGVVAAEKPRLLQVEREPVEPPPHLERCDERVRDWL